ncbi:MAG: hypothetical protein RR263_01970 [Oscillospiraceae bacterium]
MMKQLFNITSLIALSILFSLTAFAENSAVTVPITQNNAASPIRTGLIVIAVAVVCGAYVLLERKYKEWKKKKH